MVKPQLTGVVLAGGRGQRMGGVDKGLALLRGRPLVAHVVERLLPQVDAVLINANRNLEAYARLGYPVAPDAEADFAGPLAGLRAALTHSVSPWVLTVPCDAPFFPVDLVDKLRASLVGRHAGVAVARTAERVHPVFCLASRDVLAGLDAYLAAGGRRFGAWLAEVRAIEVGFGDTAAFANLNTLDDLELAFRANMGVDA